MFNSLVSLDAVDDARVLDLFAGSGALGIEALSRGAGSLTMAVTPAKRSAPTLKQRDFLVKPQLWPKTQWGGCETQQKARHSLCLISC
jgi:16S rRNA (guanine966-N2)-methyltransferase